jgi:outer membrane protein
MSVEQSAHQRKEAFTNYFPQVSASAIAMRSFDYLVDAEIPGMNLPVWDRQDPAMLENPTQFAYIPFFSAIMD